MDPVRLTIALGPVCVYLIVIGCINVRSRPFVTNGARDFLALAVALTGLVAVGPIELFMPDRAAAVFGGKVWIPLILLYLLTVLLIAMVSKPRIVVYNITADQLRSVVGRVVSELDPQARWAGDNAVLPTLGVQMYVHAFPGMRNIQLVAAGIEQNLASWKRLEVALQEALKDVRTGANPRAINMFIGAAILAVVIALTLYSGRDTIAEGMRDFLRL